MNPDLAAVFDRAADLLIEKGWCQMQTENSNGAHCAIGAVLAAPGAHRKETYFQALNTICKAVNTISVIRWNDAPERTADDVIGLFRRLAAEQRGRGARELP